MRFVEGEGGSIDEAIAQALQALGATRDQVEIDILENAVRGLLGFGRRRARVRATVRAPLVWQDVEVVRTGAVKEGASVRRDAPPAVRDRRRDAPPGREPRRDAAAPRDPRAAAEPGVAADARVVPDGFDAAALVTEVLRLMGWTAGVRLAADADPQILEITSGDPAVAAACSEEVLRALGFLVSRIAERQGRDGRRFEVTLAPGAHGPRPPGPVPRAPERARSHSRERRGGGRPRR